MRNIRDHHYFNKMFGKKVVHVETLHVEKFVRPLIDHAKKYHPLCFCLTPANYGFAKYTYGTKHNKEKFSEVLKERYMELWKYADLQLHVHLCNLIEEITDEEKEKIITEAYNWFVVELGIKPTKIVFGWYEADEFSEKVAEKLGMEVIGKHFHIYDRWLGGVI